MQRFAAFVVGIVLCLPFLGWGSTRIVQNILFDIRVEGRIKRAADANTVELAQSELEVVVAELERCGWTEGYTSLLYRTPNEDVGFWYKNLKSSLEELKKVTPQTTQLERSNLLIKLRETLLDQHGSSLVVTAPPGIAVYPYNWAYAIWGWLGTILLWLGVICIAHSFFSDSY